MPTYDITGPDGKTFEVTAPDGASEAEVLAYAQKNFKMAAKPKAKPFGEQLNDTIADVPRALGRTARAGLQGVGGMLDLVASPVRGALNMIPGVDIQPGVGRVLADGLGLPKPRPGMEAAADQAAELVAGGGLALGAANVAAKVGSGTTAAVGRMMAANPAQQLGSAAGAGLAGGYTRETGGNEGAQFAASLAGGLAAPMAMSGLARAGQSLASVTRAKAAQTPVQIDITINNALKDSGLKLSELPAQVAQGIRADVAAAYKTSGTLSPDAVRRLADYRLTGLTPTAAKLTLDPAMVTQQENLAKLGANSRDPAAQALALTKNANSQGLTQGLNKLGAATADDAIAGGEKVMGALTARNNRAQSLINDRYAAARATDGRSAALDPYAFTQRANNLLDDALLGEKLPADVRNLLNKAAKGEMPLTVDVAEQFKTRIGDLQRSTTDMAERKALGMVRSALDDAPLLPGQQMGAESIKAFNKARSLNRKWMQIVERTPALEAVRDGIEPDKFVQQFIVGTGGKANAMDVAMLKNSIKSDPVAMTAVKEQITAHLKAKALNGNADEVGNFGQSAYNKALNAIGDRKLKLFFSNEDIAQLKALGRVASYEQFQPTGSAVNNSNTASAGLSAILDRIGGSALLSKIPMGGVLQDPIKNIAVGMQAKRSLDAPRALGGAPLLQMPKPRQGIGMSPAVLMGVEDEEKRGY